MKNFSDGDFKSVAEFSELQKTCAAVSYTHLDVYKRQFLILAAIFHMDTILWICKQLSVVAITGVIVIFQPELRRVLEQLGEKKMLATLIPFETGKTVEERISDRTISELIHAVYAMGEVKTGALIVVEQNIILKEYEKDVYKRQYYRGTDRSGYRCRD